MKFIFYTFLLCTMLACSKSEQIPQVTGDWTIITSRTGTGSGDWVTTSYNDTSEWTIRLDRDGGLHLLKPSALMPYNFQDFDRYELLSENQIRFFHSATGENLVTEFSVGSQLFLSFPARCGHEEIFIRR